MTTADLQGDVLWIGNVLNDLTTPHRWEYLARTKTGKGRAVKVRPSLAQRIIDRLESEWGQKWYRRRPAKNTNTTGGHR